MNHRFNRQTVSVAEAQRLLLEGVVPGPAEPADLEACFGRTLAEPVAADHPLPPFRRSGVDGFAVRAADTRGASPDAPVPLGIIQEIPSGTVPAKPAAPGTASRIMTGAMLPAGADAVVMLEMTEVIISSPDGVPRVAVRREMAPGDNVTPAGQEAAAGQTVLPAGRRIGAGEAAVLATFGQVRPKVYRAPRVALIATGAELLPPSAPLAPGRLRESNTAMLAALVRDAGGVPLAAGVVPDDEAAVRAALERAACEADVIVTTGGVSVGDYDVMADLFAAWEETRLFRKVAMRPGSPTSAGRIGGRPLVALSGNPSACFVGAELFVRPLLNALQGRPPLPAAFRARLAGDFPKGSPYPRYMRGRVEIADGEVRAHAFRGDKSSSLLTLAEADCLIVLPAGGGGTPAGALVDVIPVGFSPG